MKDKGYVRLERTFFDTIFWKEDRIYSKAEAMMDIFRSVAFEPREQLINSRIIEIDVNQWAISRKFLCTRWGWGSTKLENFLSKLEAMKVISREQAGGQTILTLINSGIAKEYKQPTSSRQAADKQPTSSRQAQVNTLKALKALKSIKNKKEGFRNFIFENFSEEYPEIMLDKFSRHWSEPNSEQTQLRWEGEEYFDPAHRLKGWHKKHLEFEKAADQKKAGKKEEEKDRFQRILEAYTS